MRDLRYSEIIERMRWSARLKNDSSAARALGITPQALSNYKKRGAMPANLIIKFADIYNLSVDWLLTGKGEAHRSSKEGIVGNNASALNEAIEFQRIIAPASLNPDEIIYLSKLLKVLRTSDKGLLAGVKCCVDSFVKIIESQPADIQR